MSREKLQRKKQKAIDDGNLEEVFLACSELAAIYNSGDEFEDALKEYKEAKTAAEAAGNVINVAIAHRMIGEVYGSMLKYELAIKHQLKYLDLSRSQADSVQEQRALANLGHMQFQRAECDTEIRSKERNTCLTKAKSYCKESLRVSERLTNVSRKELVDMQARLYNNLGLILEQQGDADSAISYFHKAIQLSKSQDIWETLQRSYAALGSLYHNRRDHANAVQNYDRAMDAASRMHDDKQTACDLLVAKADVLFDLPDFKGAKQCLLKAYKLNTSNQNDVEKRLKTVAAVTRAEEQLLELPDADLVSRKLLYERLGDGCAGMRSYTKALEYYYFMLETAKQLGESGEQLRPCYVSLSQTYKDNKQYELALKYFNEELQLNADNPAEACKTTLNIAEVMELKGDASDDVLRSYESARSLAQTAGDRRLESRCLEAMVVLLDDNDRISDARRLEAEIEKLKDQFGPFESSSESEEEDTPDIGADICIEDISDDEGGDSNDKTARTRKRCPRTKFRRNEKGEFPLHTACISGNLTLIKKLLDQGHPVNVRDHNGWLPLHEACNFGYADVTRTLLEAGAAANDRGAAGCDGTTPLLDAAMNGNFECMRLLMRWGASPTMRTNKGETVLDALVAWRKRFIKEEKRDLDPESLEEFNSLVEMLKSALRKAGHNPEAVRGSPTHAHSPSPPPTQRPSSKRRTSETRSNSTGRSKRPSLEDDDLRRGESMRCNARSSIRRSTDDIFATQASCSNRDATREYEDAMKALRRKPTVAISSQGSGRYSPLPALVDPSSAVKADEWLEDDLARPRGVKRRRPVDHPRLTDPDRPRRPPTFRPLSPVDFDSGDSGGSQESREPEIYDVEDTVEILPEPMTVQDDSPVQNGNTSLGRTMQPPLSAFGLVSHPPTTRSPPSPTLPPPANPPMLSQPPSTQSTFPSSQQVAAIKVRIEGKLLLVPLPASSELTPALLTVAWLAEEAAKRYYSFEGVEPKLSLRTDEGALLCPGDPVALALSCREVEGAVTSWTSAPSARRYREACAQLAADVDPHVESCLDISQTSFCLNLADYVLDAEKMSPVVQACLHQTNLRRLLLADNRLCDVGLQMLAKLIVKLPHLRELDLTCNGITSEGLNILVNQILKHEACKRLEVLRLCHNRLGPGCVNTLARLLSATPSLSALYVSAVGIDHSSFAPNTQLPFGNLVCLDLSNNEVGEEGVRAVLRTLDASRAIELRLAHAARHGAVRHTAHWLLGTDPRALRQLDLANCPDHRASFTLLAQCLERAPNLEELRVSPPPNEVSAFTRLPLQVLRLTGMCAPCPAVPPLARQFSCLGINPAPTWAKHGPFGLVANDPQA